MYKVSIHKCDPDKLSKYIAKNKTKAKLYNNQLEVITVDLKKTAKALGTEISDFKECDNAELARIIEDLRKVSAKPEQVKSEETKMSEQNNYKVNFQAPKINTENSETLEQSIGALKLAKSLNAVPDNDGGDDFPSETFWAGCRSMDLQDWVESVKTQPPDKVGLTSLQLPRLKQGLSIFSITIKKAYANL